jgi:ActR/RegA family two-component response regulator
MRWRVSSRCRVDRKDKGAAKPALLGARTRGRDCAGARVSSVARDGTPTDAARDAGRLLEVRRTPPMVAPFPVGSRVLVAEPEIDLATRVRDEFVARGTRSVTCVGTCESAITAIAEAGVDVAVVSSRLADDSGLVVIAALAERSEACFSVVLVNALRSSVANAARRLGARAVIERGAFYAGDSIAVLEEARARKRGPTAVEIRVALRTLLQSSMRDAKGGPRAREARVLWSLGLSDKEASAALGISRPSYREALVSAGAFGNAVRGGYDAASSRRARWECRGPAGALGVGGDPRACLGDVRFPGCRGDTPTAVGMALRSRSARCSARGVTGHACLFVLAATGTGRGPRRPVDKRRSWRRWRSEAPGSAAITRRGCRSRGASVRAGSPLSHSANPGKTKNDSRIPSAAPSWCAVIRLAPH